MALSIRIKDAAVYFFKKTNASKNSSATPIHLVASLSVEFNTTQVTGLSSAHLNTVQPEKDATASEEHLSTQLSKIFQSAQICWGTSIFGIWWQIQEAIEKQAEAWALDPEHKNVGLSLIETALIDAYCKARKKPFHELLLDNSFGIEFALIRPELKGQKVDRFLPSSPSTSLFPRLTINNPDSFPASSKATSSETEAHPAWIQSANHFKFRLAGEPERDFSNLLQFAEQVDLQCGRKFSFSLDGNQCYQEAKQLKALWDKIEEDETLKVFFRKLLHLEEPFDSEHCFHNQVLALFAEWPRRPPILLSRLDTHFQSLPQAIAHGYAGTTHEKNKGIFKGIANRCLLNARKDREPVGKYTMSGENCSLSDPIGFFQDLVIQASLGHTSVSMLDFNLDRPPPEFATLWKKASDAYPELFKATDDGSVELNLVDGKLDITCILKNPLGHTFESVVFDESHRLKW